MHQDFKYLRLSIPSGGIAQVALARPPVNAMNFAMRSEITAAFSMLGERNDVGAVILTGDGKMFSAGADLTDRPDTSRPGAYTDHNRNVRECFNAVLECPKPVIAAINGPAIGAGLVLATCCDILLASAEAWVAMPEVEVGLAGGPRHILRHFPQSDARLMMFTARRVPASELFRLNVISASLPRDELLAAAQDIASQITANSPAAVEAAKRSFILGEELPLHSGYRNEQLFTRELAKGPDFAEAQAAFREKRKPVFRKP